MLARTHLLPMYRGDLYRQDQDLISNGDQRGGQGLYPPGWTHTRSFSRFQPASKTFLANFGTV